MPKPRGPAQPGRATIAVRGGVPPRAAGSPVSSPLFQSVNFVQDFGTAEGLMYTRYGNTPNEEIVQKRIAMLEGAEAALVLSSGMGATACALLALLRPGDHLLSSSWIYGGTRTLFTDEFASMGIEVSFADPDERRVWRNTMRQNTRAIFVESPVNPTSRVLDLTQLAILAKLRGVALVVDSTLASPINSRPIAHGADVVIHSATKYLNGHHDILCGVVAGTASYIDEVKQKMMVWGQAPDPFACWLLERGLKTLDVRVKRSNENTMRVAEWCAGRSDISMVHYAGLPAHPDHSIAKKHLDGFGGLMSIELTGGAVAADRFVRKLKMITHASSLGGVDTLVVEPRYSSHAHMTSEQRAAIGIPDGFLRLSIGIEDVDDIIADIEQALQ
ncbi:MAG: PLP-dependent transferase [Gemmatimonadaceae bacterium]|nr:PLP-dependent transferase [Gemmatimonadaceae bacterium]MDQ3242311.1 PLP-dependent aspartate aminotransferase family protein [Gemmatimonadota bacterium]